MTSPYFLTTERLGFRRWAEDDFELALELWGDADVMRFIDARGQLTEVEVRERLAREIAMDRNHGIQYWPIFLLETEEHVGCCGLRPYDLERNILELGFQFGAAHWGNGYATEACRAVIELAFDSLNTIALFAGHHPANEASRHVLEKLGFRHTHDEVYEPTGLRHPSYLLTDVEFWTPEPS